MQDKFEPLVSTINNILDSTGNDPLSKADYQDFLTILRYKKLNAGEYFVFAGSITTEAAYLVKGMLRYFYIDEEAKEYTRYFCQTGNFVSSYTALLKNEPSEYSIQAIDNIELICFNFDNWLKLTHKKTIWSTVMQVILNNSTIISEERERSLVLDNATTRYRKLLKNFPNIENKVKQYDIASYLGITAVALSRIRKTLK